MKRIQVSDDFGNTQTQTAARLVSTFQPVGDNGKAKALAEAFASGELLADTLRKQEDEQQQAAASRWANSMTVSELGKAIREGKMLPSQSPVFAATAQHIWGRNAYDAMEREVMSKITTGEMKFNSPEEVDTYITEARNTQLSGQSKFAVAGFDKGFTQLRPKLLDGIAKANDKEMVERTTNEAVDALSNTLLRVSGDDFTGTPQDAAAAVMKDYQLLRQTKVMPDAAARGALGEMLVRASASGKVDLVNALLDSELPDVGKVRGFLGETKAATMVAQATNKFDQGQRQRIDTEALPFALTADEGRLNVEKFMEWATSDQNKKYIQYPSIMAILNSNESAIARQQRELQQSRIAGQVQASEYEARKRVDAALSAGRLWEVQGTNTPQVLTRSGTLQAFNVKAYAEEALKAKTAGLPFDQQVSAWAMNGMENPDWSNQLHAGFLNLASIGTDSTGKPSGVLNEAGKGAIELFRQLDAVSPDAAKQTAGEGAYQRFSDIAFLMHLGRDPSDAASIAANASTRPAVGSGADKLSKSVAAEVARMTDTPWSDWFANKTGAVRDAVNEGSRLLGMFGHMTSPVRIPEAVGEVLEGGLPAVPKAIGTLLGSGFDEKPAPSHVMRNTTPNTAQVHRWVSRYANLLAHSGQVGDAESALKLAVEYIQRPEVSALVNGTMYLRSEMPSAPSAGKAQAEWLERFIDEVPKARAQELGFAGEEVRLEYDERARVYRAFVHGFPLTDEREGIMVFGRSDIEKWYATRAQQDVNAASAKGNANQQTAAHARFRARLHSEVGELQKQDQFVMERYDGTVGHKALEKNIFGKDAYARIVTDGNQDKPLAELMRLYPSRKSTAAAAKK